MPAPGGRRPARCAAARGRRAGRARAMAAEATAEIDDTTATRPGAGRAGRHAQPPRRPRRGRPAGLRAARSCGGRRPPPGRGRRHHLAHHWSAGRKRQSRPSPTRPGRPVPRRPSSCALAAAGPGRAADRDSATAAAAIVGLVAGGQVAEAEAAVERALDDPVSRRHSHRTLALLRGRIALSRGRPGDGRRGAGRGGRHPRPGRPAGPPRLDADPPGRGPRPAGRRRPAARPRSTPARSGARATATSTTSPARRSGRMATRATWPVPPPPRSTWPTTPAPTEHTGFELVFLDLALRLGADGAAARGWPWRPASRVPSPPVSPPVPRPGRGRRPGARGRRRRYAELGLDLHAAETATRPPAPTAGPGRWPRRRRPTPVHRSCAAACRGAHPRRWWAGRWSATSRPASARSCCWPGRACPAGRSPSGSTSRCGRSTTSWAGLPQAGRHEPGRAGQPAGRRGLTCPSCPRSRRSAGRWSRPSPAGPGRRLGLPPPEVRAGPRRRRHGGHRRGPPRQVPAREARRRARPGHPPGHDRFAAHPPARRPGRRLRAGHLGARRRGGEELEFRDVRRFGRLAVAAPATTWARSPCRSTPSTPR